MTVRRTLRDAIRGAPILALAAICLAPQRASAADFEDCRGELEVLRNQLPDDMTPVWGKMIQEELSKINALSDRDSLMAGIDQVEAEYERMRADPDVSQKLVEARAKLYVCHYLARAKEVAAIASGDSESSTNSGEAPEESGPSETEVSDLRAPPKPIESPSSWFSETAYPPTALRAERSGVVRYDVTVGADGSVKGCQASGPPDSADLESATCDAVLARARFEPAKDAAGKPVVGEISGSLRWTLPE